LPAVAPGFALHHAHHHQPLIKHDLRGLGHRAGFRVRLVPESSA
jgi:hypothetical protein